MRSDRSQLLPLVAPLLLAAILFPVAIFGRLMDRPPPDVRLSIAPMRFTGAAKDEPLRDGWTRSDTGEQASSGVSLHRGPHGGVLLRWYVPYGAGLIRGGAFTLDGERWHQMTARGEGFPQTGYGLDSFATTGDVTVSGGTEAVHRRWKADDPGPPDDAVILRSTDGVHWRRVLVVRDAEISDLTRHEGRFVAQGYRQQGWNPVGNTTIREPTAWTSLDGLRWSEDPDAISPPSRFVAAWRGRLVTIDDTPGTSRGHWTPDENVVMESTADGTDAQTVHLGRHVYRAYNAATWEIAATRRRLVAIGRYDWSPRLQTRDDFTSTAQLNIQYLTETWTTTDDERWTRCSSPKVHVYGLTILGDRFVAASDRGLMVSDDGCDWNVIADAAPSRDRDALQTLTTIGDRVVAITGHDTGIETNKGPEIHFYAWTWTPLQT